jgi:GT2 family glycosyltransferase
MGKIQHVGGELRANGLSYHLGEGEEDRGQYTGVREAAYVQGAAMAVRREVFERLGGFDENFFPAYYEEADFCLRVRRSGGRVGVVCEAAVAHHQDPVKQVHSERFLELYFRGRARFLIKNYRLRDWIFRYFPAEARWLASRDSKRYRRIALKSLWEVWRGESKAATSTRMKGAKHG